MAVLLDQFSYRMNKTSEGVYYDRWHGHMFPEISMPEKLYFLNRIISALLTHDKLFIRTDSIEEMIECIGFDAFRMLYNGGEIVILDNWWVHRTLQMARLPSHITSKSGNYPKVLIIRN